MRFHYILDAPRIYCKTEASEIQERWSGKMLSGRVLSSKSSGPLAGFFCPETKGRSRILRPFGWVYINLNLH